MFAFNVPKAGVAIRAGSPRGDKDLTQILPLRQVVRGSFAHSAVFLVLWCLLACGCGAVPAGILPGDDSAAARLLPGNYSGTIVCTRNIQDGLGGFEGHVLEVFFDVGIRADGELLIDGAPVQVGDRFVGGGNTEVVVRDVSRFTAIGIVIITYDESGVDLLMDGTVAEGFMYEEFHFTPPRKILYLRERILAVELDDVAAWIIMEDCEGLLFP